MSEAREQAIKKLNEVIVETIVDGVVTQSTAEWLYNAGYRLVPELKTLGDEKIKAQIKYLYEQNPHLPIEVMLEALCESIAQAQRDYDLKQIREVEV